MTTRPVNIPDVHAPNASSDLGGVEELERRLAQKATEGKTVPYAELFRDVPLQLANGRVHVVDHWNPSPFDRNLFDEYLGYLNQRSYASIGLLVSVLVVRKDSHVPADRLFDWIVTHKFATEATKYQFWEDEVHRMYDHFRST